MTDDPKPWTYELRRPDGNVLWRHRAAPYDTLFFGHDHPVWDIQGPAEAWSRRDGEEWRSLGPWTGV